MGESDAGLCRRLFLVKTAGGPLIQDGRDIGRIFKPSAGAPDDRPWMWTITGAIIKPSHGFAASLAEAKAKFAETWRRWLASRRGDRD